MTLDGIGGSKRSTVIVCMRHVGSLQQFNCDRRRGANRRADHSLRHLMAHRVGLSGTPAPSGTPDVLEGAPSRRPARSSRKPGVLEGRRVAEGAPSGSPARSGTLSVPEGASSADERVRAPPIRSNGRALQVYSSIPYQQYHVYTRTYRLLRQSRRSARRARRAEAVGIAPGSEPGSNSELGSSLYLHAHVLF